MRIIMTIGAAIAALAAQRTGAQTARDIVARSDSVRNPLQPFHVTNAVVNYVGAKAHDRVVLTVYTKRRSDAAFDNLVRYADPPRDAGKMVLFTGTNMWFYDPSSKASVRISPQQRLIGLASNGDVVAVSLERDYTSSVVSSDTLQDADRVRRVAWHLDLVAANKDAVYGRIELWVEQGTYRPVKSKYYSDNGRLLKIAYFHKYEEHLGAVRPGEVIIIDAVNPNLVTTMTLSDYVAQDIPDAWFQRDFLPRVSDAADGGEDRDLASLPPAVQQDDGSPIRPTTTRTKHARYYVEDAATATSVRSSLAVPQPGPAPPGWIDRTSADARGRWQLSARLTLNLSARANVIENGDVLAGYDLRAAYLTWQPATSTYLEAGRINVHNGVALGFNPTDFFRSRTLIDEASQDPSVRRDDRLGTLMVRAEHLWTGGAASIAFAPKLYAPSSVLNEVTSATLALDRTNAATRWLATAGADVAGLTPQLFFYHESARSQLGAALSRLVSQSVVAYAEYAGGVAPNLMKQAVDYGKTTGSIPATTPAPPLSDSSEHFRSSLAAGASWAASAAKLTINAEFHYYQAGFDHVGWRRWFAVARTSPAAAGEMWYIRAFANDQQQPMARQQLFLRADRVDAVTRNLELTGFAFVSLADGSSLIQLAASYLVTDSWTIAAFAGANVGGARSERGSLPPAANLTMTTARYF